jgi:hypothetical protein
MTSEDPHTDIRFSKDNIRRASASAADARGLIIQHGGPRMLHPLPFAGGARPW